MYHMVAVMTGILTHSLLRHFLHISKREPLYLDLHFTDQLTCFEMHGMGNALDVDNTLQNSFM